MGINRDVPRTAAFAWAPGPAAPLIATGTKAGAMNSSFSSETQLELWDLGLDGSNSHKELQPIAQISTDSRFHDLAWVQPKSGHEKGILAGGLESGSLDLWDAAKLLEKQEDALLSRTAKHTGAIKALQFNSFRPELLATTGQHGELYIWDTNNIANPFRLGGSGGRADDFECLNWNEQVPHIMATGSSGGQVTVWDVKAKKESMHLNNYGRKAVSAVAWDPEKSTRLITAVPLDTDPVILIWDLRNANAPEKVLRGHEGGVLSLSWCRSDRDLLLSSGKDNRTICWNPQTGESYGKFPVVTDWAFQTRWNPHNPGLIATASFDGKIAISSIQNTKGETAAPQAEQSLEGADFFDRAATQPQTSSFSLPKPPRWLERRSGASFGFGGKLISFKQTAADNKPTRTSTVRISNFTVDDKISGITEAFAKQVRDGDLKGICQTHISDAGSESEKNDWEIIETLLEASPRRALIRRLGLADVAEQDSSAETNGDIDGEKKKPTLMDDDDDTDFFGGNVDGDDDGENLLSRLASSKGVKTNSPFELQSDSDSDADKAITRALTQGQFTKAMEVCIEEDRLSDALIIAMFGGDDAKEKVKQAYFKKQSSGPKYIRLLASIIGKNLWDVVHNADLSNWKEVMASLCTYARDEFSELCTALGDRLEEQSHDSSEGDELRQSASFCYIAGSNLEKVLGLWITELQRNEEASLKSATGENSFSIHAAALQSFIEKVTVFREAVHYETDTNSSDDSKLDPLYQRYIEYADIVAAHGQLQIAEQYLRLLPPSYQTARDRVQQAVKPAQAQKAPVASYSTSQPRMPRMPPQPTTQPSLDQPYQQPLDTQPSQYPQNSYAPPTMTKPSAPYPGAAPSFIPQTPSGAYRPPANPYQPYQQQEPRPPGPMVVPPPLGGPPRNMTASPSIAPPSQDRNMKNWNDMPEDFFKAPTPRRGTPSVPANAPAPAPNPYSPVGPPGAASYGQPPPQPSQPLPPPKGPAPPPRTASISSQGLPERPPSTTNYGPPPSVAQPPTVSQIQSQIPRGPSPYNPPPSSGPAAGGSSRYAPAPAAAPAQPGPPTAALRSPPPPNPYAPPPSGGPRPGSRGPVPMNNAPPTGPPPTGAPPLGPPPSGPPPSGPPRQDSPANIPPPPAAASRLPPGDRTHIPAEARPVYELLSADMQRVKAKAPASFSAHVTDTEKRLNILFDHLNNQTLLTAPTIGEMVQLATALSNKDYDRAMQIHMDLIKNRSEECTNWMTGVKRLISMSRATP